MNYQETLEYLFSQLPVYQKIGGIAYKEGLDNSLALDIYFDHPHASYKTIHIAGTNGKGSTSSLLAAILQKSGYKVGLYTSPHLVDFRERIRVNGEKISEQYVIDFVEKHHVNYKEIEPSFFELTMMMAFLYFEEQKVDVAIIETGLGGRLDSTNIINPDLCVITNIALDHVQFLGDTEEQIAYEKAGIIKKNTPVIIGEADGLVRKVFEEKAKEMVAPIIFAEDKPKLASSKYEQGKLILQSLDYGEINAQLAGYAQVKNANTVLWAIDALIKKGYTITEKAVKDGFANVIEIVGLLGRWQTIKENPRIILDTGHNTAGVKYIAEQLKHEEYEKLHIVFGVVDDKDVSSVLKLLPKDAVYYFTRAEIPRSLDQNKLSSLAHQVGLKGEVYSSVKEALSAAKLNASTKDLIFVGGSNFIVGDALIAEDIS